MAHQRMQVQRQFVQREFAEKFDDDVHVSSGVRGAIFGPQLVTDNLYLFNRINWPLLTVINLNVFSKYPGASLSIVNST